MIIDEALNSDKLIEFMQALIKESQGQKIFLIVDNRRVHHSKPVKEWAELHQQDIELFYLPSYSPELNPVERLNADRKHAMGSKVAVRARARRRAAATEHMTMLDKTPERARKYSGNPHVAYATS